MAPEAQLGPGAGSWLWAQIQDQGRSLAVALEEAPLAGGTLGGQSELPVNNYRADTDTDLDNN